MASGTESTNRQCGRWHPNLFYPCIQTGGRQNKKCGDFAKGRLNKSLKSLPGHLLPPWTAVDADVPDSSFSSAAFWGSKPSSPWSGCGQSCFALLLLLVVGPFGHMDVGVCAGRFAQTQRRIPDKSAKVSMASYRHVQRLRTPRRRG
jgi:hypothetical protein